jgi:hypothetical protein
MAGRGVDLKNEEEVREYLENLGIEYRFGCYHEKNPKGLFHLCLTGDSGFVFI